MKKKKKDFVIRWICEKCGNEQKPDEKQSNENWAVYPNVPCEKCGGKFKPKIED